MTDTHSQAVVDKTDTHAQPGSEVDGARKDVDDLDALLAEFDQQTKKPDTVTQPVTTTQQQPDLAAIMAEVQAVKGMAAEAAGEKHKRDMTATVKDVRGDLDPDTFDDTLVEAWLDAQARNDPRLQQAWLGRDANPKQFAKVKAELGKQFARKFGNLPDKQATEDRAAVAASMRGASSRAPEDKPVDTRGMSNAEYRKHIRDNYGFDPGV